MMWVLCPYYNACGAVEGSRLQKKIACGCLEIQNGNGRRHAGGARRGARKGKERLCYNRSSSPGRYRLGVRTEDSQSLNGPPDRMAALIFLQLGFVGLW